MRIFTAEADESPRPWSGINSWMQVMCQGVDHTMPPTGWFGLPSGVVVPEANNGLLNAFQFSGFYCHFDGTRFDNCPNEHNWHGNANLNMDGATVSGNSLVVNFVEPFEGDPFCAVSFENIWVHHRMDTYPTGVTIWIADASEQPKQWSSVASWMMLMCTPRPPQLRAHHVLSLTPCC